MRVKVKLIEGGKMPEFKTVGAVCADCYARVETPCVLFPYGRTLVPLGFALGLRPGYEAVIRPRSGLSSKGIDVCIGTIDFDYRGEVKACVINNSSRSFEIADGDRICQIAVRKVPAVEFESVETLDDTERGESGFGSTGI